MATTSAGPKRVELPAAQAIPPGSCLPFLGLCAMTGAGLHLQGPPASHGTQQPLA